MSVEYDGHLYFELVHENEGHAAPCKSCKALLVCWCERGRRHKVDRCHLCNERLNPPLPKPETGELCHVCGYLKSLHTKRFRINKKVGNNRFYRVELKPEVLKEIGAIGGFYCPNTY